MTEDVSHSPHRNAWLPPAGPARDQDRAPEPASERTPEIAEEQTRKKALEELADLIAELERWRRRQSMRKPPASARWVFVRDTDGTSVRVRFEQGLPVQLRTRRPDRGRAIPLVARALDMTLSARGVWSRDQLLGDWCVDVCVAS